LYQHLVLEPPDLGPDIIWLRFKSWFAEQALKITWDWQDYIHVLDLLHICLLRGQRPNFCLTNQICPALSMLAKTAKVLLSR
jgi:hypothetical protein